MLDENGHVIGVNTLIISPTKFYVGYGYAVPPLAKRVVEQIIETSYHVLIGIMMGTIEDEDYHLLEQGITLVLEIKEVTAGTTLNILVPKLVTL